MLTVTEKKLADSRKRAKILADNRKCHHPIETLLADFRKLTEVARVLFTLNSPICFWKGKTYRHKMNTIPAWKTRLVRGLRFKIK